MQRQKLAVSYCHTPGKTSFRYCTIPGDLKAAAECHPDRDAFRFLDPERPRRVITFGELDRQSDYVAAALHRLGIRRGERVGIFGPNTSEWLLAEYGILKTGAISVHVSMSVSTIGSMQHVLNKTGCVALLLHPGPDEVWSKLLKELIPELNGHSHPQLLSGSSFVPTLRHVVSLEGEISGAHSLRDWLLQGRSEDADLVQEIARSISVDDPAVIFLTSGSTGFPKAALHSHFSVLSKSSIEDAKTRGWYSDVPMVLFNDRPFTHAGGRVTMSVSLRATCITMDTSISVKPGNTAFILKVLEEEKCTNGLFFPYLLQDILGHPRLDEFDLSALQGAVVGGQIVTAELMKKAIQKIPGMANAFGSTESMGPTLWAEIEDPLEKRIHKIGRPSFHTEVKIVDANNIVLPVGTVGEICARGPDIMLGYYGDPEKTREVIDEAGWYHFGDLAVMDEEGYVTVVGRMSEVIKRATMKIYPKEIENTIMEHPAVEKVQVVGVPDMRLFEEICACVQFKENATCSISELDAWCRERFCPQKTLDGLGLMPGYFLEFKSYPVTATGKYDRKEISRIAGERLHESARSRNQGETL